MTQDSTTTYYAITFANGPISVELHGVNLDQAIRSFVRLDGRAAIDDARTDAEDALEIDGAEMSEEAFDAALESAGARVVLTHWQDGRLTRGWAIWVVDGDVSDEQIESLRAEASEAGDDLMLCMCDVALGTDFDPDDWTGLDHEVERQMIGMEQDEARRRCAEAINSARAMVDDDGEVEE